MGYRGNGNQLGIFRLLEAQFKGHIALVRVFRQVFTLQGWSVDAFQALNQAACGLQRLLLAGGVAVISHFIDGDEFVYGSATHQQRGDQGRADGDDNGAVNPPAAANQYFRQVYQGYFVVVGVLFGHIG